jgi:peptide/nickel transport system permease protein
MPGGSAMREYLIKRLVLLIPTFLGITLVVYSVLLMLPGDPVDVLLGQEYDAQIAKQLRAEWGLDQPVIVQYIKWLQHIVRGDWGRSLFSWWDYAASTFALVGVSIPSFFLGILFFLTFGLWLGWLPVQGYVPLRESVGENLRHLILPTLALGVARTAILTRLIRGSMLEVIHQEYVMTARSKGLAEALVINKHALKNALIPAVTVLGLQVGFLVGGAIIIEKLFALPGIGSYGIDAITNRDYPQVLGFILISALVFQVANLAVDLVYCFLDPRIRYGKAEM